APSSPTPSPSSTPPPPANARLRFPNSTRWPNAPALRITGFIATRGFGWCSWEQNDALREHHRHPCAGRKDFSRHIRPRKLAARAAALPVDSQDRAEHLPDGCSAWLATDSMDIAV